MLSFLSDYAEPGVLALCGIGILLACFLIWGIKRVRVENDRMNEIASYIKKGAMAYLYRQYRTLAIFLVVMFCALAFLPGLGLDLAGAFLFGAVLSVVAGYLGMRTAVISNVRTAAEARNGISAAFRVAFSGGAVMGIFVVTLGAFGIALLSLLTDNTNVLTGFSLGASSIALFCRVGGGIYTKAADVGADLVGKVEAGIPEDDPKNPAVIADNVGDNVGDVAGMGADLFESYVGCIVAAMLLVGVTPDMGVSRSHIMLLVAGGLFASLVGIVLVRLLKVKNAALGLNIGTYTSSALLVIFSLLLFFKDIKIFFGVLSGIVAGVLIGKITEIYTSSGYKTVKEIAKSGETGYATNILSGYAAGMKSTALPLLVIVLAIIVSYRMAGGVGVVLAALGMLTTVGMVISVDAYGPIADNAGGIAQMSGLDASVREITDNLDSVGNTTAAIGKGFSIGSAALTSLALIASYGSAVDLGTKVDLLDANFLGGLLIGGMLSFLFSALTINSVSRAANDMINEVRRQFREHRGIMEGTETPDYEKCVDISTKAAIREMILPGVIAIAAPLLVGLLLGKIALAGLLIGATLTGILLAISMSNSGGAWDNAKKYIEEGNHGGKGSEAHKAAVMGDTVGDPLKDTAGPSLNILIKLMSIVAVVFAPLFM
ncbi:MAG: sodium-translocating pyrophosphatase [Ruminococcaceae bacterium]|nr:sodium-translocating pyrophosphatase [Oscillospiraceae bacterium]